MNMYKPISLVMLFVVCCKPREKIEPSMNIVESRTEFWTVERDAITVYPDAHWHAVTKEEALIDNESKTIVLSYPRRKIYLKKLNNSLKSIYEDSSNLSEGEHYNPYVSDPPVVRFAVFDNESQNWYMLMLDNVSKDRFKICKYNTSNSSSEIILAEIPPYRESRDFGVITVLLAVISKYTNHPELEVVQW